MKSFFITWWLQILEGTVYFLVAALPVMLGALSRYYENDTWDDLHWKGFFYVCMSATTAGLVSLKAFLSQSMSNKRDELSQKENTVK